MALGMSYADYWYGDPMMLPMYIKYNRLCRIRADEQAWLTGAYVYRALNCALAALFAKSNADLPEYPERPYLSKDREDTVSATSAEDREKQELLQARLHMEAMKAAGKNWGKH